MSKNVIIIGGGIIGLCSAYYLQKEGHQITIIDQSNMNGGASYINAGYLSPSHIIPLSAPGVMKKGLKWMFDKSSPLYIKPRIDSDFLKWTIAFNKSCNSNHVVKAIPAIKGLTLLSQDLLDDIKHSDGFSFHYEKKGLLMFCQTDKILEEEIKNVEVGQTVHLKFDAYNHYQYGIIKERVSYIDKYIEDDSKSKNFNKRQFYILVDIPTVEAEKLNIQNGLQVSGEVIIKKIKLYQYITNTLFTKL